MKQINAFIDGDQLCIVKPDFINLRESQAIFLQLDLDSRHFLEELGL